MRTKTIPEEKLAAIEQALANIADEFNELQIMVEEHKKGKLDPHDVSQNASKIMQNILENLNRPVTDLSFHYSKLGIDNYVAECQDEFEKSGRKFSPKTQMEQDLWDQFHDSKKEGYAVIVWTSDSFSGSYPFYQLGKNGDMEEALKGIENIGMTKLMACMNLLEPFEDQWPYIPGVIWAPLQLTSNPVNTIPKLPKNTRPSRHANIRGVVDGGSP